MPLSVNYGDRVWSLDFARIDVDDMETIEDYTGSPGNSWLSQLVMTDRDGNRLTADMLKQEPAPDLIFSPKVKFVRCAYWVMLRQNGEPSGPIGSVKPEYSEFTAALLAAMVKNTMGSLKTEVVDPGPESDPAEDAFLPKDSPTGSEATPGSNGSLSVPVNVSA